MAETSNPPIGNEFFDGPLGVVDVYFDNEYMGRTTEDTNIEWIEDIADIFYAQNGTQPADKIPTGQAYQITTNFAELNAPRIAKLNRGATVSSSGKSLCLGPDLYRSGIENFSKKLELRRVDSAGNATTDPFFTLVCLKAFPTQNSPFLFGPETQRTTEYIFYIFKDPTTGIYIYTGYPSSNGIAA